MLMAVWMYVIAVYIRVEGRQTLGTGLQSADELGELS